MPITPKPLQVNYRASQIEVYCKDCGTYLKSEWCKNVKGEIAVEPCKCPLSEIRKVFEKYKHLDTVISDVRWIKAGDFKYHIIRDLWQAIKASLEPAEAEPPDASPTP